MKSKDILVCENLLQKHGYRVTRGRVALLVLLKSVKKPLTIQEIQESLTETIDKVTLYRALLDFAKSSIVSKMYLHKGKTFFEFIHHDHHHHHIVCESCGVIEEIDDCAYSIKHADILRSSKKFAQIHAHSLEFFGLCASCSK